MFDGGIGSGVIEGGGGDSRLIMSVGADTGSIRAVPVLTRWRCLAGGMLPSRPGTASEMATRLSLGPPN